MKRKIAYGFLFLIAAYLLGCAGFAVPIDLAFAIAVGWVFYLARVVPEIRIGWGGVLMAVVCLVGFSAGSHAFFGWLYSQVRATPPEGARRWSPRWTAALVSVVVLMFVAGMATAGVAHQMAWLFTADEPFAGTSRGAAMRAGSTNNLKQIGLGLHNYNEAHKSFPPFVALDGEGRPLHGWQTMILPYIEQADLYNQINLALPWDDPANARPFHTVVNMFLYPDTRVRQQTDNAGYALSYYAANASMIRVRSPADVKDGASTTIMAGEVKRNLKPWGDPVNWRDLALGINRRPDGFGGPSPGGANFLFVDGSVRFISDRVDPRLLKALGTPAGGEKLNSDEY
jgi:prepilin-type processing-associated H-X9-DG protein